MQVIDAIEYILPLVFLSEVGDGLNGVCGGVQMLSICLPACLPGMTGLSSLPPMHCARSLT